MIEQRARDRCPSDAGPDDNHICVAGKRIWAMLRDGRWRDRPEWRCGVGDRQARRVLQARFNGVIFFIEFNKKSESKGDAGNNVTHVIPDSVGSRSLLASPPVRTPSFM